MNTSVKKDAVPNYSKEQEKAIIDASPLCLETAKALGESFDPPKSYRSIIAKAKSLGCEYISKPPPSKKVAKVTKAELVEQISLALDRDCIGLEKSPVTALVAVINGIDHLTKALEPSEVITLKA